MLIGSIVFVAAAVIIAILLRRLADAQQLQLYWKIRAELYQHRQEYEQQQRMAYERAMALPLADPQRSAELWARAQQGDELAHWIIIERLANDLNNFDSDHRRLLPTDKNS